MISDAIISAFKKKQERGWDKIYWMIDVHDTILKGEYSSFQDYNPPKEAIEVLKMLSSSASHVIIIWTSSYAKDYKRLSKWVHDVHGIKFDYHNENPECENTELAEFTSKFYFNIGLDDKFGFDISKDWLEIKKTLIELGE